MSKDAPAELPADPGRSEKDPRLQPDDAGYATLPVAVLETMGAEYNPRGEMPAHEFEALKAGLAAMGVLDPIIVNRRSPARGWPEGSRPTIVGGHQRVKAARAIGMDSFPVFWVDLDRLEERAGNVALNRIAGVWDLELRGALVGELKLGGFDLSLTGLNTDEIGVDLGWSVETVAPPERIGGGDGSYQQMTFIVSGEHAAVVQAALSKAKQLSPEEGGAESKKSGAALVAIARAFLRG